MWCTEKLYLVWKKALISTYYLQIIKQSILKLKKIEIIKELMCLPYAFYDHHIHIFGLIQTSKQYLAQLY